MHMLLVHCYYWSIIMADGCGPKGSLLRVLFPLVHSVQLANGTLAVTSHSAVFLSYYNAIYS